MPIEHHTHKITKMIDDAFSCNHGFAFRFTTLSLLPSHASAVYSRFGSKWKPPPSPGRDPSRADVQVVEKTTVCPFCSEPIKKAAKKCKHCREILDVVLRQSQQAAAAPVINISNVNTATASGGRQAVKAWSPVVAALLSLLIPGLGQLYKWQLLNAIIWFFVVLGGYALLIVPGVILHICCVCGAAMGNPYR
ncbi:MAG: hypothetical protein ACT4QC_04220 [Planctomycetaceae bacterium]